MFGAEHEAERKGLKYLLKALEIIKEKLRVPNIALATFGYFINNLPGDIGCPVYQLGYIRDELLLSCCYSAADILVVPSLEDNFPNIILEAFSCQIPVIASNAASLPELILPQATGLLAKKADPYDLAEKIQQALLHPDRCTEMGVNARKTVEQEYTTEIQAKRYQALFESLL